MLLLTKLLAFEHDSQRFTNLNFRIVGLHQKLKKDILVNFENYDFNRTLKLVVLLAKAFISPTRD